jgi:hypothetical protein
MPYIERKDLAEEKSTTVNQKLFPNVLRVTENYAPKSTPIYIYNVGPLDWGREQGIQRVPNHPHLYFKACPSDKEFELVGEIGHPFPVEDFDTNGIRFTRWTDGYSEASKMLNPQNPGLDQNWDGANLDFPKNNLNNYGIFWSESLPPKKEEIASAKKRLEATFAKELSIIEQIEREDPAAVKNAVTRTARAAANYFSNKNGEPLNFSWYNTTYRAKNETFGKVECENCFNLIHPKTAKCSFCGLVRDKKRALELGLITDDTAKVSKVK